MDAIYRQKGEMFDYRPESDVDAGDIIVLGKKIGVATNPIPAGSLGSLVREGVIEAPVSTAGTYAFGDALHWGGTEFAAAGTNGTHGEFFMGSVSDLADGRGLVRLV